MTNGAGRRDPRSFEPPPWEREQFKELEKHKVTTQDTAGEEPETASEPPQAAPSENAAEPALEPARVKRAEQGESRIDEAAMLEMMAQLAAEEPPAVQGVWQLALVASTVLGSVGFMMVVFGAVGMARAAKAGWTAMFGATVLLVFGLGMLGLAGWMIYKTLKQRGVL